MSFAGSKINILYTVMKHIFLAICKKHLFIIYQMQIVYEQKALHLNFN